MTVLALLVIGLLATVLKYAALAAVTGAVAWALLVVAAR